MKAEFELNIDKDGLPVIKFRHHDKDNSMEQNQLRRFVELAIEKGITLKNPSGYLEVGTDKSWENYEITLNP